MKNLKEFIKVEAGEYDLEDIGKVEIEPFEIGKYLVTNVWFKEFIEDGGYQNRDFWSKAAGRKWLKYLGKKKPYLWDKERWNGPDSPVIGVSWYEAVAFTRWLTLVRDDGNEYRLLTEKEWQAAAAGHEGRKYPWGNRWDKNRCNSEKTRIGKTSPVGTFKKGNTLEGVSDMAGNVWEWTGSFYDNRKSALVLRGGSWRDGADYCRCAIRGRDNPRSRPDDSGFRCARTVTL